MNGETAFFKLETDFVANANRCYLETDEDIQPEQQSSKGLTMNFADGETSSIRSIGKEVGEKAIYTVSGQRVESMSRPGLYIVGGRKIVVR